MTLTNLERLVLSAEVVARMTQTLALTWDSVAGPGSASGLWIDMDQATFDVNAITSSELGRFIVTGTAAANTITAHNQFRNNLQGEAGDDRLIGGAVVDLLIGGRGADSLTGGLGNDDLEGGGGRDRLDGGRGDDELSGDGGRDLFVFAGRSGDDDLYGFRAYGPNRDVIDLTANRDITGFRDLTRNHLEVDGDDLILMLGRGNSVRLFDVDRVDLDPGDFLFRA